MPFPLLGVAVGLSIASAGAQAGSSILAGKAAKSAARRQAAAMQEAANRSLDAAGKMVLQTRYATTLDLIRRNREARIIAGAQKAAYGKSGIVSSSGSARAVMMDSAAQAGLDAMIIRKRGQWQESAIWQNAQAQADALRSQGVQAVAQGNAQATAGYINAGASLLQGAANAINTYAMYGGGSTKPDVGNTGATGPNSGSTGPNSGSTGPNSGSTGPNSGAKKD